MTPDVPCGPSELRAVFGAIDIYVFDQLLKGRLTDGMRVLDAGCGSGRNSEYLMACGAEVFGVDSDASAIERIRTVAARRAPALPAENFQVGDIADLPFPEHRFDAVICSAVLHFAQNQDVFEVMVSELWRVLKPGGLFLARLASTIGLEDLVQPKGDGWFSLPDGSDRFLVDEALLLGTTEYLGGELLEPIKTTNVQNLRAMTTWVMRRP